MISVQNILLVVILITDLTLAANSRLGTCINLIALQGFALGLVPVTIGFQQGFTFSLIAVAFIGILLRGILFPQILHRSIVNAGTARELRPLVSYFLSVLIVLMLIFTSLWISINIDFIDSKLLLLSVVALSTIFSGIFIIIGRRLAIMQIIGYILLENGIYCLGLAFVQEIPMIIELGVLFDAIIAVFVMSVATNKIQEEFEHLDIQKLDSLKG